MTGPSDPRASSVISRFQLKGCQKEEPPSKHKCVNCACQGLEAPAWSLPRAPSQMDHVPIADGCRDARGHPCAQKPAVCPIQPRCLCSHMQQHLFQSKGTRSHLFSHHGIKFCPGLAFKSSGTHGQLVRQGEASGVPAWLQPKPRFTWYLLPFRSRCVLEEPALCWRGLFSSHSAVFSPSFSQWVAEQRDRQRCCGTTRILHPAPANGAPRCADRQLQLLSNIFTIYFKRSRNI